MSQEQQLASCLLPAGNNPAGIARAVLCYQQQLWKSKELIVVDYGRENIAPLLEDLPDDQLRYIRCHPDDHFSPSDLWNKALDHASGEFIIHWDPADWHHPERILRQAELLQNGYRCCYIPGTLLHLDHPEYVHHPYVDLPSGVYSGTIMYRNRDQIHYPEKYDPSVRVFLSQWEKEEIAALDSDLSWLIVRTLTGDRKSRAYKKFISGYRNNAGDLARLVWGKIRGRNMVSHPRFRLSPQARESFSRYMLESKKLGLITSIS